VVTLPNTIKAELVKGHDTLVTKNKLHLFCNDKSNFYCCLGHKDFEDSNVDRVSLESNMYIVGDLAFYFYRMVIGKSPFPALVVIYTSYLLCSSRTCC